MFGNGQAIDLDRRGRDFSFSAGLNQHSMPLCILCRNLPRIRMLRLLPIVLLMASSSLEAGPVRILSSTSDGLTLELELDPPQLVQVSRGGRHYHELSVPGSSSLDRAGEPALPFFAELLAVPPGAQVRLEVEEAHYIEWENILFVPVSASHKGGGPASEPHLQYHGRDAFAPAERASSEFLGIMRGVPAHSLCIFPFSYNETRRVLRIYQRLQIRVRFAGGGRAKALDPGADPHAAGFYGAFLNRPREAPKAVSRVASYDWYDPASPWIKVFVDEDGLFRIDPAWLKERDIDVANIDPRTLQLYCRGEEQTLDVHGQGDGSFDQGDHLVFHGRLRRDDRDFESIFGRRNTYWLTWGRGTGRRFVERSGAPVQGYPSSTSYWTTGHFERDLWFEALEDAPDNMRDHWFWHRPVFANSPNVPSSRIYVGELTQPDLSSDYTAHVRLAVHGATSLGHHTVLKLNNHILDERIWSGQVEMLVGAEIASGHLRPGPNQVLLQAFADQAKWDKVLFNWFEIDYRRLYMAMSGYLAFSQPPSAGHRIEVSGFSHPRIQLYDVANEVRFVDLVVEEDGDGTILSATFEDRSEKASSYVMADSMSLRTPTGIPDEISSWRSTDNEADYLIIAHPLFLAAARRLADHRSREGLVVEVVSTEDLYDEFSHGLLDREAIAAFIRHSYHNWQRRPAYVLLLGDATYDYRNILGGGQPSFVPTLYYQARERGHSPSDYLYALVDGDDILPDLSVGRLAVGSAEEAEQVVEKVIRYDREPEPGAWRSRVLFLANYHENGLFAGPSDDLAARYTEPLGLESVKVYGQDESPIPNRTGRSFVDALNAGALLLNFNGHGSAGTMQFVFSSQLPDWDYLSQVRNGGRLPLVLALSCFNGLFANPVVKGLAEIFTNMADGGSIAYISASAKSFVAQNNLLAESLFRQFFERGNLEFGPALDTAKGQVLAAHSSWRTALLGMQLLGDPAQKLALPHMADYTPLSLQSETGEVFGHSTVELKAILRNNTRSTRDSLEVVVLAYSEAAARPETLFHESQVSFGGDRELAFDWPVGDRRGPYRLEILLDPQNRVEELDEGNNSLQTNLEILEPLMPAPFFPPAHGVVAPEEVQLEAGMPLVRDPVSCEFALSPDPEFEPGNTRISPLVPAAEGLAVYRPAGLDSDQVYFWKARVHTSISAGPWSPPLSFQVSPRQAAPQWRQEGLQFLAAQVRDLVLDEADGLVLSPAERPLRPSSATREDGFTVRGLEGAGVLCTDGTYLYAKRWYNDASTIYPGTDFFARIGTGFNGTRRGALYGSLADSTTAGISATYHGDGYIYNDSGRAFELERISVESGIMDTVEIAAGLLEWKYGRIEDGHSLITSDGRYIYNASMSSEAGTRNEWRIRVFDPAADWSLLRDFTSPPTENGFTFEWTDGLLADGRRLYLIEFSGRRRIRMVDALDGRFLDEWTSDQDTTRIISGQYDWANNKVWLGDLFGPAVFRYAGLGTAEAGQLISDPIGPASTWQSLRIRGAAVGGAHLKVDVLGENPADASWNPVDGLVGLPLDEEVELAGLSAEDHRRIRLRADLQGTPGDAVLESWEVEFDPLPSLQLLAAEATIDSAGLRVQVLVRNITSGEVSGARLQLQRNDLDEAMVDRPLGRMGRGETREILIDSLFPPPAGVRLFAQVVTSQPDAEPGDNRREILLLGDRALVSFKKWPGGHPFLDGDPLLPEQALLIQVRLRPGDEVVLRVDGDPVEADSVFALAPGEQGIQVKYQPKVLFGTHELQVDVLREHEEIALGSIRFLLSDKLAIVHPLLYPHPVKERTSFTYLLSRDARVTIEVYSLSGRLINRLSSPTQSAGFQQVQWDGRDRKGRRLANGTYLYRIVATGGGQNAEFRGPLSIWR